MELKKYIEVKNGGVSLGRTIMVDEWAVWNHTNDNTQAENAKYYYTEKEANTAFDQLVSKLGGPIKIKEEKVATPEVKIEVEATPETDAIQEADAKAIDKNAFKFNKKKNR